MTSKPTAWERFEEIKKDIGIVVPNEAMPKRWHDHRGILTAALFNQDMQFLFSVVEAAVSMNRTEKETLRCVAAGCDCAEDKVWHEIDQRLSQAEGKK